MLLARRQKRQDTRQDIDRRRWKRSVDLESGVPVSVIDLSRLDSSRPKRETVRLLVDGVNWLLLPFLS